MTLQNNRTLNLALQLTAREFIARYKNSFLGLAWMVIVPIALITMYTFVFSVIFQARWPSVQMDSRGAFAVILFVGVSTHSFLSESLIRAPMTIVQNGALLRKVVLPIHALPISTVLVSLVGYGVAALVTLAAYLVVFGAPPVTVLLTPLAAAPLIVFTLGATWFLSALGVYLRDLAHMIGLVSLALLFLCPIFYPMEAVPDGLRGWLYLNPLTVPIINLQALLFGTGGVGAVLTAIHAAASAAVAAAGFGVFKLLQPGFHDQF